MSSISSLFCCCFGSAKVAVEPIRQESSQVPLPEASVFFTPVSVQMELHPVQMEVTVANKLVVNDADSPACLPNVALRISLPNGGILPIYPTAQRRHHRLSSDEAELVNQEIAVRDVAKELAVLSTSHQRSLKPSPSRSEPPTPISQGEMDLYVSSCCSTPCLELAPNRETPSTVALSSSPSQHLSLGSSTEGES